MQEEDDTQQKLAATGWTNGFKIVVQDDKKLMALAFDFSQDAGTGMMSTPMQVVVETEAMMGLLLSLKEIQRMFDLPMPEIETFSLMREEG